MIPIIFGISGTKLTQEEMNLFAQYQVAGFILFSRNIESKAQLIELTSTLKNLYPDTNTTIFVDQEGGKVARIKPPIVTRLYPSAEHFANIFCSGPFHAEWKKRSALD